MHFQRAANADRHAPNWWSTAGSPSIRPALPGVPDFAVALLDEGTAHAQCAADRRAFAQLGAAYGRQIGRDASVLSVDGLARNFPRTMALLADVVQRPTFPADEIERARRSRLASRRSRHARTRHRSPTQRSAVRCTGRASATARRHWARKLRLRASTARCCATSGSAGTTRPMPHSSSSARSIAPPRALGRTRIRRLVGRAAALPPRSPRCPPRRRRRASCSSSAQASTRPSCASAASRRRVPAPTISGCSSRIKSSGGGLLSRLNMNLREAKGYAYGAFSRFDFGRMPARSSSRPPFAPTPTRTRQSRDRSRVRRHARERRRRACEFAKARDGVARSLPGAFKTNGGIAGAFAQPLRLRAADDVLRHAARPGSRPCRRTRSWRYRSATSILRRWSSWPSAIPRRSRSASDALGLAPVERIKAADLY